MSDSNITKKAIVEGFKELARTKPVSKISIADITNICGLNRQTFYYHFQDKFELLHWIYYNECFIKLVDGIDFQNWNQKLLIALSIINKDKAFYRNTIKGQEEEFKVYLFNVTNTLFCDAIEKLDSEHRVNEEDKKFYAEFFSYGICGIVIQWIKNGMKETPEKLAECTRRLVRSCEKLAFKKCIEDKILDELL